MTSPRDSMISRLISRSSSSTSCIAPRSTPRSRPLASDNRERATKSPGRPNRRACASGFGCSASCWSSRAGAPRGEPRPDRRPRRCCSVTAAVVEGIDVFDGPGTHRLGAPSPPQASRSRWIKATQGTYDTQSTLCGQLVEQAGRTRACVRGRVSFLRFHGRTGSAQAQRFLSRSWVRRRARAICRPSSTSSVPTAMPTALYLGVGPDKRRPPPTSRGACAPFWRSCAKEPGRSRSSTRSRATSRRTTWRPTASRRTRSFWPFPRTTRASTCRSLGRRPHSGNIRGRGLSEGSPGPSIAIGSSGRSRRCAGSRRRARTRETAGLRPTPVQT
jgi:hypothetical protein